MPLGSMLEQKNKGRSRVKFAFFCVVGVHVAALMVALLSQGCKRSTTDSTRLAMTDTNLPIMDTNPPPLAPATSAPPVGIEQPLVAPTPPGAQEYVIQKGDSYSIIAKKYPGVTWKAIQDANPGVDPLKLQPGKKIMIPAATVAPVTPSGTGAVAATATGEQVYAVKSGDTLTTIASRYGTTVKALRAANSLTTDKIKVGQKLKIPAKGAAPVDTVPAAPPPAR